MLARITPAAGNTPRTVRSALEHEEPQRPSEMAVQEAEGGAEGLRTVVGREEREEVRGRSCGPARIRRGSFRHASSEAHRTAKD